MRLGLPIMLTLLAASSGSAIAGVVVTSTSTRLDTKEATQQMVYAEPDKLKVVNADTTVIYRGDLKKFWMINPAQKTYVEMTPEAMQQMSARLAGVQAQMQAQMQQRLANMPPAQRAQMEAMLQARGLGGAAGAQPGIPPGIGGPAAQTGTVPKVAYIKAGLNKNVAKMRCDMYRKTLDGEQDEDVCIAPITAAGLTAADFRVLDSLNTFVEPVTSAPQMPRSDFMSWAAMNRAIGFQGLPLDTIHYLNGMPEREETVQKIERTNIPASTFELPPGLTQRTFGPPPGR
jgi:hypothetical protein